VLEAGELIGPYRLVSQLGKGAMGEVWRARDERLDRYVALKVLPPDAIGDVELRARMLREARAAAAIRNPNVVTLFDIVDHAGSDILVMELVEGKTLKDRLAAEGRPPLEVALRWIEGVADALVAAHARGILHRDIKAANVMVTGDGVKVLDFGLAKLRDSETLPSSVPPRPPRLATPVPDVSLDETVKSTPVPTQVDELASYRTHAGALLGTPLYMAPEQVDGALPDEVSEVFSVGVLAHEVLAGVPPYTARHLEELFRQIAKEPAPPLPEDVPDGVCAIVARALAKDRARRFPSMTALRDAIAAERKRLFAPPARRWPLTLAAAMLVLAAGGALAYSWMTRTPPARPGDEYVARALEEYDVFYNEKAVSSLRAALATAPEHPRANAYVILLGGSDTDRARALAAAKQSPAEPRSKDRALLDTAIALEERGPKAARAALASSGAESDRERAFWTAELDYRAGNYAAAHDEYAALLADPAHAFRGRIYDHFSSVLLYLDEPREALRIGSLYRDAFPGEADAVGVYATTLAAAGQYDKALAAAEEALRLSEGEDTLAGLAKVTALAGDHRRARELYQRSLERAGPTRRPVRRAALGFLQWIDGDVALAAQTVAPCLPGGSDAAARERGACLFVAGVIEPARANELAAQLEALAREANDARPPYGAPLALAALVRARAQFFGGACVSAARTPGQIAPDTYDMPLDFYAAYHVPFFATWQVCERAAALAAGGDRAGARAALAEVAARAPNRRWIETAAAAY